MSGSSPVNTENKCTHMADINGLFSMPDPRKFVVVHCDAKAQARRAQLENSKSSGLMTGLGKLAGIAGTGVVQEGLSTIVKTVGVGGKDWEDMVNAGAKGVMTTVLGDQSTNYLTGLLEKINPGAVNKGVSTARIIHDKIKERDFNWRDVPQYVADFKNLYQIGSQILDPFLADGAGAEPTHVMCSASPYAMDLVKQGAKFKFLFIVEFKFYAEYQNLAAVEPTFVVKSAERPSITYEYEDINMYNFRTKVAKRGSYSPINMSFHDDEQNRALSFYNAVQRLMSPIANNIMPSSFENSGMDFKDISVGSTGADSPAQGIATYNHAASLGPLLGDRTSIIERINLYHVYMGGAKVNQYTFHRPRIMSMNLDDMDMSSEQTTELKLEFAYDSVEIINAVAPNTVLGKDQEDGSLYPLGRANNGPGAPISESPTSIISKVSSATGFPLAEAFARGESFIEGLYSNAKSYVSDAVDGVSSYFNTNGDAVKTFGANDTAAGMTVSDTSPLQTPNWTEKAVKLQQAMADAGVDGSVQVIKYADTMKARLIP